jgi:hypothetical protein
VVLRMMLRKSCKKVEERVVQSSPSFLVAEERDTRGNS